MMGPTEAQEQATLFEWAHRMEGRFPELALLHAIPNGGSRNPLEAVHLKQQGVKPGIPDIFLPVASGPYHGLYIEMKRRKGGRVSVEQKKMLLALRSEQNPMTGNGIAPRAVMSRQYLKTLRIARRAGQK